MCHSLTSSMETPEPGAFKSNGGEGWVQWLLGGSEGDLEMAKGTAESCTMCEGASLCGFFTAVETTFIVSSQ